MPNRVSALIVDEHNLGEMARHGVSAAEVVQVIANRHVTVPKPRGEAGSIPLIGETDGGRLLTIPLARSRRASRGAAAHLAAVKAAMQRADPPLRLAVQTPPPMATTWASIAEIGLRSPTLVDHRKNLARRQEQGRHLEVRPRRAVALGVVAREVKARDDLLPA